MATQDAIAKHLDLTQPAVSKMLKKLNLTGEETLETIRVAYIRNLREQAAGHVSDAGLDLVQERAKTEIVERQILHGKYIGGDPDWLICKRNHIRDRDFSEIFRKTLQKLDIAVRGSKIVAN